MPPSPRQIVACLATVTALLATACSGGDDPADDVDGAAVTAQLLPPISQPGRAPAPADDARALVSVRADGAGVGVPVTVEQDAGSGWVEAGTAETSSAGTAEVLVDGGPDAAYRVSVDGGRPVSVDTSGWTLVYSDEFAGTQLDRTVWWHRGGEYNPEGLRACSKGSPKAVDVSHGVLNLRTALDPERLGEKCEAKAADGESLGKFSYRINGHLSNALLMRFGVTAARIKFAEHRGQHGSFWFQATEDGAANDDPKTGGAEIDVVEYFGESSDDRLASFVYYPTPDGMVKEGDWIEEASRYLAGRDDDWWKRFHVFTLEWTEEEYVVRIDGQEAWRTDQGVSHQSESLILSLLSSDYELPKLKDEALLPQTMQVDWVRHWSADPG